MSEKWKTITRMIVPENINKLLNNVSYSMGNLGVNIYKVTTTEYMRNFVNSITNFLIDIEKSSNNPESFFNYTKYKNGLDDMHWAWPYNITAEEIQRLLQNTHNEREFDLQMQKFFKKSKIDALVEEISTILPFRHRIMLIQAKNAFDRKDYAIANNALISIIDNMLAKYLFNKGQTKRVGILKPILRYYGSLPLKGVDFIFELYMLSNNIDFIFQDCQFDQKLEIKTNKKVRRHPALHGVRYSNKKLDTLLLLNCLFNLVKHDEHLKMFEGGLVINKKKKEFRFIEKLGKKLDRERCIRFIISAIQNDEQLKYKDIFTMVEDKMPYNVKDKHKYLSQLLQKMKKEGLVEYASINGEKCWILK